ncbi:MAG: 3-dehydroquinate synthase [Nitrospirae bacterium]|nr:3-dehydroquinate synthase [Nitrospirota bacterium]
MEKVTVPLGARAYDILIGHGTLPTLGQAVAATGLEGRCVVVTNPTVGALYEQPVLAALTAAGFSASVCRVPDGERFKTAKWLGRIHDHLLEQGLDRHGFIVALGGGVVGDMAGFAAATFLRGIPFVQVPTTVVAQVDSSVGGKTGVNHPRGKNLIGAFHQPRLVFMDMAVLATLPRRELLAGMAEVIKYGVIADRAFFDYLRGHVAAILALDPQVMARVVGRCCAIKAQVVADDETETSGRRAILNYGHTVGHAVEAVTGYRRYKHGEAVAMGMVAAARIAHKLGRLDARAVAAQVDILEAFGLPVALPRGMDPNRVVAALGHDKKAAQGRVKMVLASAIGQVELVPLAPDEIGRLLA